MFLMEFSSLAFLACPASPASLLPLFLPIPFHTLSHHTYSDTVSLAHYKINIFFWFSTNTHDLRSYIFIFS